MPMRLPGASQCVCSDVVRDGACAALTRAARGTATAAKKQHVEAEGGLRLHKKRKEKRYPKVPVQLLLSNQSNAVGPARH